MLTENGIKALKHGKSDVLVADGRGLSLLVKAQSNHGTPSKLWRYRYKFDGRPCLMSLGSWPDVSLKMARDRLQINRTLVADGVNPTSVRKEEKALPKAMLAAAAEEWIGKFGGNEVNAARIRARFSTYILPSLGNKLMRSITKEMMTPPLEALISTGHTDAAHRCRRELKRLWHWAIFKNYADVNIIAAFDGQLKSHKSKKHPGFTKPADVGKLLLAIDGYGQGTAQSLAASLHESTFYLKIMPYLGQRPSELRLAKWDEIDFDTATWRVPFTRMKEEKEEERDHLVPLPTQVLKLLTQLQVFSGDEGYLFKGINRDQPISDGTANKALRLLGYNTRTQHCAHGFRSTMSSLLSDMGENFQAKEAQLAHNVGGVAGVYDEAKRLDQRRPMMQRYADFLDGLRAAAKGTPHSRPSTVARMKSSMSDSSQRVERPNLRPAGKERPIMRS